MVRVWLGDESARYNARISQGSDAASEPVQEQVANEALTVYVCVWGMARGG
jgi:hypothetical protein